MRRALVGQRTSRLTLRSLAARVGRGILAALFVWILFIGHASAQQDERPSNRRAPLPLPTSPSPAPLSTDGAETTEPSTDRLATGLRLRVTGFDFEGNTAFSDDELRTSLNDLVGQSLDTERLLAARDRLTQHYVDAGYATSGAILPDQVPVDGRVRFKIIEGRLSHIRVEGTDRFSRSYFADRLSEVGRAPVLVPRLEEALRFLQEDPLIERVTARLEPGTTRGSSQLHLTIEEARQENFELIAANDRSPSIGEETGQFRLAVANLTGHRDRYQITGWFTEGLRDIEGRFAHPINRWDTRVEARVRYTETEVVEFPFDPFDIESKSLSVSLGLFQPVYRTKNHAVDIGIRGDWRQGESTLSGRSFCFQPEVTDCDPTIAVLRLIGQWNWRDTTNALSFRSTLSIGTDALGATKSRGGRPGGEFVAWLGQAQYTRAMPLRSLLISRINFQRTEDALLSFERIAVGGARTVRGYRPNQLVRDSGLAASVEWRVPVWRRAIGPSYLDVIPFIDVGHAWNERDDRGDNTLTSIGLGLIGRPHERVEASVYWGTRLLGVSRIGNGLIDHGLHLQVTIDAW